MASGIRIKARAFGELIRLDLAFGAGFFLVAGQILALGRLPPPEMAVAGFVMLFFISGTANISNDYFDREVDRFNRPGRPLPSGRVSARELWTFFFVCSAVGFAAATFFGPAVFATAAVLWALSLLYNIKLKEYGAAGNLIVAFCVGMTIIMGGITAGVLNGLVLLFGALAFLFDLGEEIAADAMDLEGDRLRPSRSLANILGRKPAIRIVGAVFAVFFALTLVPVVTGRLGCIYLLLAVVVDLWMIRCVVTLLKDRSIEDGHKQIKRLYLSWGVFVIMMILMLIFLGRV